MEDEGFVDFIIEVWFAMPTALSEVQVESRMKKIYGPPHPSALRKIPNVIFQSFNILLKINSKPRVVTIENPLDASSELLQDEPFDLVVTDVNKYLYGFEFHQMISGSYHLPVLSLQEKKGKRAVNTALPEKKGKRAVTGKSAMEQGKKGKDNSVDRAVPPKTKLKWTESLHNKFVAAIKDIGFDEAKPAKILEHMKDPTLTRRNIASHLQKYRIHLRQVTDASSRFQAPDMNLASRVNQWNAAYGAFGECSQFHQENVRVQSSIPSSSAHASTGYLTDNLQHLKNKGVNAMEESEVIGDLSTTLMNQGNVNVQPHQQNDENEMSNSEFPWWWL